MFLDSKFLMYCLIFSNLNVSLCNKVPSKSVNITIFEIRTLVTYQIFDNILPLKTIFLFGSLQYYNGTVLLDLSILTLSDSTIYHLEQVETRFASNMILQKKIKRDRSVLQRIFLQTLLIQQSALILLLASGCR